MNKRFSNSLMALLIAVSTISPSAFAATDTTEEAERRDTYIAEEKQEESLIDKWSDYRDYLAEYNEKIAEGNEYSHYYAIRIQIIEHLIERIQSALEN